MSGGPPHHPHGRQAPAANSAWNPLQVPNYFPSRQPQHAHMSNDHSFLHQPTWHTPTTTEPMKPIQTSHLFSLEQMLSDRQFARHAPGVDLSVTRNGSQNGDIPTTPISLSVRDANKINSLPPGALEVQAVELTKCPSPGIVKPMSPSVKPANPGIKPDSPGLKPASPGLKSSSPALKSLSPGLKPHSPSFAPATATSTVSSILDSTKNTKRSTKRVDSILQRLNPSLDKTVTLQTEQSVLPEKPITPIAPVSICAIASATISTSKPTATSAAVAATESSEPLTAPEKLSTVPAVPGQSVIVQPAVSSHDENSNSSSILNVPTPTNVKEDDVLSPCSNEDSLDSNKSRRKRKPSKTMRVSKEDDRAIDSDTDLAKTLEDPLPDSKLSVIPESPPPVKEEVDSKTEIKSAEGGSPEDELDAIVPAKTRRKSSSEAETIDNIAAMVQEAIEEKKSKAETKKEGPTTATIVVAPTAAATSAAVGAVGAVGAGVAKPVTVSVIKTKDNLQETLSAAAPKDSLSNGSVATPSVPPLMITPAQKKATNTHFVEVENKLEEMFAGIDDNDDPLKTDRLDLGDDSKMDDSLLKLDDSIASTSFNDSSVANDLTSSKTSQKKSNKKPKVKTPLKRTADIAGLESSPKKKKSGKKSKSLDKSSSKSKNKKLTSANGKQNSTKLETVKDVYAYDSSSNTSSNKSRGPFIHIKGPRDSPISVNVVNTPTQDDDPEKKVNKTKKYHDDSEYRHKVRSKGLHSSTLSNKYDAQTRDVSWICAFCKRGPHGSHMTDPSQRSFDIAPGDLFGPYFIGTNSSEFDMKLNDPYDKNFKSKKISKMLDAASSQPKPLSSKKSKKKHSDSLDGRSSVDDSDLFLGITDTGNKTFEVWAHEDCIVWSPGVYLVGSKIVGLEEAVWTSSNVACGLCHLKGANLCCLKRGCANVVHFCCAKGSDWLLDEDNFKAYCPQHKTP